MKVNKNQLQLAMAHALINPKALCKKAGISYPALRRALDGGNSKPATIGRLAAALGVNVVDVIEQEK